MPNFEHTLEVEAPIERVYEFGIDPDNWHRTTPSLTDVTVTGETDDGFSLDATWNILGMALDGDMEFEIVEPNEHTITRFESPGMTGELHYEYSETETGTLVVQRADYEFGESLLQRLIEPVARRYNKRQFENTLRTSKELIEAEVAAESTAPTR